MSIELLELFLSTMTMSKTIEGNLPSDRELAVDLIDYMHDKCENIVIWIYDEYQQYHWYSKSKDNESGWISAECLGSYITTPTKDLPFEGSERVKFVNIQKTKS